MDPNRAKPLVLHVDDSSTILIVAQGMLAKLGCDVITAHDGAEGLAMAEKHLPDLILLDTQMPELDGYQVCAKLKGNPKTKGIPIIMVTGMGAKAGVEKGVEAGANGYIHKPIEAPLLEAKINELVKRPGGS